ncbi:MFS transporter [Klebsiella variicola subsp. variicola]|nr:MFS transporter [Klebsiella variicola subsp. variicola]
MAWFYTDVFGLSPAHMGTMFLAVRVLDAVTDVLMGRWLIEPALNMVNSGPIFYGLPFRLAYCAA